MGAAASGLLQASWLLPPADVQPKPRKSKANRRSSALRQHGPDPLASAYAEGARVTNVEKPWVQRLLAYTAVFIICLAPCVSLIALVGWALTMDAEDLRSRIDLDIGLGNDDDCVDVADDSGSGESNVSSVLTANENKLEAAVATNFTTLAILLGVYWVLHCKEPRRFYKNPLKRGFGPPRPRNAWGWLPLVMRMPLDEVEKHVGADGRALLEFIQLALRIMALYSAFAVLSLATYLSTSHIASAQDSWVDPGFLESASLLGSLEYAGRLDSGWHASSFHAAIWFSVLCSYILSILALWQLRRSWVRMIDAQQQRMVSTDHVCLRTVLVKLSAPQYSTEALRMWQDAYPGAIESVRVVRDSRRLPQILSRAFVLAKEIKSLEEELAQHAPDADLDDLDGELGTKQARVTDVRAKLDTRLAAAITEHEEASAAAEIELTGIDVPDNDRGVFAFICFKTRSTAHFAQQVMTSVAVVRAWPAPADEDVNWPTLYPDAAAKIIAARATVTASYFAMLCFYSLPIAFVSSLISLEALQENMPSLRVLLCAMGETVRSFLGAFLPQLALKVFMAVLPAICLRLAWLRGSPNLARVEVDAILNLWLFQFVWLLFGAAAINGLVAERSYRQLVLTMGEYSIFLMIYLNVQATVAMPLSMLTRAPQIAMEILARRLRKPEAIQPEPLPFHSAWSMVFLSTAVGMVYAVAYPMVIPFVMHHLGTAYLLFCRSLLFSNSKGWLAGKLDGGKAAVWPQASKWLLIMLLVGQGFVAGAHLADDQWITAICFIPLFALNFVAHRHFTRFYKPKLKHLSIASCNHLDDQERALSEGARVQKLLEIFAPGSTYVQPDMRTETWARLREGKTAPPRPGDPPAQRPRFRIAVFGASGGVGRHVVRLLLQEKHTVAAFARDPADIEPRSARRLKKFKVDMLQCNPQELARLLKGCNFVVSCLGNRRGETKVLTRGTVVLVQAMQTAGIARMAMLSCVGVRDSQAQLKEQGWKGWVYSMMFATVLNDEMEDLAEAEVACHPRRGPAVATVVVRASDLSDERGQGSYCLAPAGGRVGATVTREDVASFMVSLITDEQYDGTAISIGCPLAPGEAGVAAGPAAPDRLDGSERGAGAAGPAALDRLDGSERGAGTTATRSLSALWDKITDTIPGVVANGHSHEPADACPVLRINISELVDVEDSSAATGAKQAIAGYHARSPEVFFQEYRRP